VYVPLRLLVVATGLIVTFAVLFAVGFFVEAAVITTLPETAGA
jgi:hypothetical protein